MHAYRNLTTIVILISATGLGACSSSNNPASGTMGGAGASSAGGNLSTGGTSASGGDASHVGGTSSIGGSTQVVETGGAVASGGTNAIGGTSSVGGAVNNGGTLGTGGSTTPGGTNATGGAISTGGTSGTVGTTASCHAAGTLNVTNQGMTAYLIDGSANPALTLCRRNTYTFALNAPGHPFYINTVRGTGTANAYSTGVTGNGTETGNVTFVVDSTAPNTLFYNCSIHAAMTGTITVVD